MSKPTSKRFIIKIQVGEEAIFDSTNKSKDVAQWVKEFHESKYAERLTVWRKDGLSYVCTVDENKKRIGF